MRMHCTVFLSQAVSTPVTQRRLALGAMAVTFMAAAVAVSRTRRRELEPMAIDSSSSDDVDGGSASEDAADAHALPAAVAVAVAVAVEDDDVSITMLMEEHGNDLSVMDLNVLPAAELDPDVASESALPPVLKLLPVSSSVFSACVHMCSCHSNLALLAFSCSARQKNHFCGPS